MQTKLMILRNKKNKMKVKIHISIFVINNYLNIQVNEKYKMEISENIQKDKFSKD